ncbi:hypothetical protein T4B_6211 [Trichinella pseudospiralis]|uniref:Uncharacterized protein n=1 Tax=Trichinella pseudospiralis TaxID=6337 RepID=A0A0V1ECY8_TRIPS|nr:hypothetical protein T4A_1364 [Trichinella pseudospiralis]KRZ27951.1 hypothetical protein T4B_6211 [Trichinella pseudospiralis]KRZ42381.1 hypothetical protein T4C_9062 [Trichinella pseudospiralis]
MLSLMRAGKVSIAYWHKKMRCKEIASSVFTADNGVVFRYLVDAVHFSASLFPAGGLTCPLASFNIIFPISIILSLIAGDSAAALADGRSRATCFNGFPWQKGMMTSRAIKQYRASIFILLIAFV